MSFNARVPHPRRARATLPFLFAAAAAAVAVSVWGPRSVRRGDSGGARVAYFIQVGASNIGLVPRLLCALYDARNEYAVHYDAKIGAAEARASVLCVYRALSRKHATDGAGNVPNVHVVQSEPVTYRGISMTLNYMTGMSFLLDRDTRWDFFINLSAADYPTASQRVLRRLLALARGRNFVEWKPPADWAGFADRRLGDYYIDTALAQSRGANGSHYLSLDGQPVAGGGSGGGGDAGAAAAAAMRTAPSAHNPLPRHLEYTIAKSSGWFILSRAFCEHALTSAFARKVGVALGYSDASDEHLFATVLWNDAAWRGTTVGTNLRSIFFVAPNGSFARNADGTRSRQHPFWVDDTGADGRFLFWDALNDAPALFTRKVRDTPRFRDLVDATMLGLGGRDGGVAAYERRLEARFRGLLERSENADVFGNTLDDA